MAALLVLAGCRPAPPPPAPVTRELPAPPAPACVEAGAGGTVLPAPPGPPLGDPDGTLPGDLYVEPSTLHSLGFEWKITGDANRNGRVQVEYRRTGGPAWRPGMDLLRIMREIVFGLKGWSDPGTHVCGNLYAGSILFLEPGTAYDVRLTLTDPDAADPAANPQGVVTQRLLRVATKTLPTMCEGGRRLHVYPADHAGARDSPAFSSIAAAYREAVAGDQVLLHAGAYAETCTFDRAGTRDRPLVIRGAGDGPVLISGGSPLFRMAPGDYHWIQGLTFHTDGVAVRCTEPTVGLTVLRCRFEGAQYCGVQTAHESRDAYIADNEFIGTEGTWHDRSKDRPYKAVWAGGQGIDVCYNRVRNHWDGLSVCGAAIPPSDDFGRKLCALDFYNNDVAQIVDDNEADAGQHNIRFFNNRFVDVYVGLSAQPVYGGPCYFVRNFQYNVKCGKVFKLNIYPAGVVICHNTTVSGCRDREPGTAFLNRGYWNTHVFNNVFLGVAGDVMAGGPRDPSVSRMDYNGYRPTGIVRWFVFDEAAQREALRQERIAVQLPMPTGMVKYASLAEFAQATGNERHAVELDFRDFAGLAEPPPEPRNSDPAGLDARPAAASRAVDRGLVIPNLTDGYAGAAPDLGAFEFGAPPPHYGPRSPVASVPRDR